MKKLLLLAMMLTMAFSTETKIVINGTTPASNVACFQNTSQDLVYYSGEAGTDHRFIAKPFEIICFEAARDVWFYGKNRQVLATDVRL